MFVHENMYNLGARLQMQCKPTHSLHDEAVFTRLQMHMLRYDVMLRLSNPVHQGRDTICLV